MAQPQNTHQARARPFSYQLPVDEAPFSDPRIAPEHPAGSALPPNQRLEKLEPLQTERVPEHGPFRLEPTSPDSRSIIYTPIEEGTQDFAEYQRLALPPTQSHNVVAADVHRPVIPESNDKKYPEKDFVPGHVEPPMESHPAFLTPTAMEKSEQPLKVDHTNPAAPYVPYQNSPIRQTTQSTLVPDMAVANSNGTQSHLPGQVSHPNMQHTSMSESTWKYALCACPASDLSTCFMGIFCPCVLYGKTQYRLSQRSRKADPTDLLGWKSCNGHCVAFGLLCGAQGLLTSFLSARVRHSYNTNGGMGEDLLKGCCCCCCALIQDEREVRTKEEEKRRWAGPSSGYNRVETMRYEPPPR